MNAQEWLDRADALAAAATEGPWVDQRKWESCYQPSVVAGGADLMTARPEEWVAECSPETANGLADAAFIAASRTLVPDMSAALRAVLDLHYPRTPYPETGSGFEWCNECGHASPCPTIRAITDTLDGAS